MRQLTTGATKPYACTMHAVLKYDCEETPQGIYNELVAVRLAQTLHIPIATGLMTDKGGQDAFASLHVGRSDLKLPNLKYHQRQAAAHRYPDEIAALTAFDIFIGNWDRNENLMVSLETAQKVFGGIDHGLSLLCVDGTPAKSLARLSKGELIVQFHPFYRLVRKDLLMSWIERIAAAAPRDIAECCQCNAAVGGVPVILQQKLADALLERQRRLHLIVSLKIKDPIWAV
jgi:hypothetical protein